MDRVPSGLPEDRPQFDLSSRFKVIHREASIIDENVNDRMQREGAHVDPVRSKELSESVWDGKQSGNIHEVNWFRNQGKKA